MWMTALFWEKCSGCLDSFRGYFAYDLNLIGEGLGHRRFDYRHTYLIQIHYLLFTLNLYLQIHFDIYLVNIMQLVFPYYLPVFEAIPSNIYNQFLMDFLY